MGFQSIFFCGLGLGFRSCTPLINQDMFDILAVSHDSFQGITSYVNAPKNVPLKELKYQKVVLSQFQCTAYIGIPTSTLIRRNLTQSDSQVKASRHVTPIIIYHSAVVPVTALE